MYQHFYMVLTIKQFKRFTAKNLNDAVMFHKLGLLIR